MHADGAGCDQRPVGLRPHVPRHGAVGLVLDLADDFFQDVLHRDQAVDVAILVHDDGHVLMMALEVEQLLERVLVGGHEGQLAPDDGVTQRQRAVAMAHQVAQVDDADQVILAALEHRIA